VVPGRLQARLGDVLTLSLCSVLFFALCVYQLDLPGLYTDEAFDVVPAMQILRGHPVELQRGVGIHLFGVDLPLMSSSDYQGVTSTYLVLPFFALGGINVISLRLMTVTVGVVGIVVAFFLARTWFDTPTARLTALMLAVSPSWVFFSRLGVYVVSEVMPIAGGALLACTIWVRRRPLGARNTPLYVGAFLLGLGLTTKLLFVWFINAVLFMALVFYGPSVWRHRHAWWRERWRVLRVGLLALVAFCVGAFPFLLYNLLTRGTYYLIRDTLSNMQSTTHGVNNTSILRNLWTKAEDFRVLLDGSYFWFQREWNQFYANPVTPIAFILCAVGLVALVLAARPVTLARPRLAWWPVLSAVFLVVALVMTMILGTRPVVQAWEMAVVLAVCTIAVALTLLTGLAPLRVRSPRNGQPLPTEPGPDTSGGRLSAAGWLLLGTAMLAGYFWWFAGAGRPSGPAPGGFLGLWPVDAAGWLFWTSTLALIVLLGLHPRPAPHQRAVVATVGILVLVLVQSAVTVSGLWSTHLLILLPLPQMTIAAFVMALTRRWVPRWSPATTAGTRTPWVSAMRVLPALLIVGSIIALDLVVDYSYHRDLAKTGGGSTFSDAIYRLVEYLEEQPPGTRVVAMDWGFRRPIQLLTEQRVDPIEAYGMKNPPPPEFYTALRDLLSHPNTLYLFHTRQGSAYPRHDAFLQEVAAAGKRAELIKTFYHRDGIPVYEVYTVR
jgi:hypothetical protein